MKCLYPALLLMSQVFLCTAPADEIVFDFETGDLQGWRIVEGKFEKLLTDRTEFHHKQGPYNKQGKYFLSTLERKDNSPSDKATGVVESPVFRLDGAKIFLLVGGGRHHDTYVALCTTDGKQHLRATGNPGEPDRDPRHPSVLDVVPPGGGGGAGGNSQRRLHQAD